MQNRQSLLDQHNSWIKTKSVNTQMTQEQSNVFYFSYLVLAHSILTSSAFSDNEKSIVLPVLTKVADNTEIEKPLTEYALLAKEYYACHGNPELLHKLAQKNYFPAVCDLFRKYQQSPFSAKFFTPTNLSAIYYATKLLLLALDSKKVEMCGYEGLLSYAAMQRALRVAQTLLQRSSNTVIARRYLALVTACRQKNLSPANPDVQIILETPSINTLDIQNIMLGKGEFTGKRIAQEQKTEFTEVDLGDSEFVKISDDEPRDVHRRDSMISVQSLVHEPIVGSKKAPQQMSQVVPDYEPIEIISEEPVSSQSRMLRRG